MRLFCSLRSVIEFDALPLAWSRNYGISQNKEPLKDDSFTAPCSWENKPEARPFRARQKHETTLFLHFIYSFFKHV